MDTRNFDGIVRNLNTAGSRRNALMVLAAGGLGLGFLLAEDAEAKKKKNKRKKKKSLAERCKKSDQCGGGLKCELANSQNSCFASTEKLCCKPIGARCDDGCECCGVDVICNGHICSTA